MELAVIWPSAITAITPVPAESSGTVAVHATISTVPSVRIRISCWIITQNCIEFYGKVMFFAYRSHIVHESKDYY